MTDIKEILEILMKYKEDEIKFFEFFPKWEYNKYEREYSCEINDGCFMTYSEEYESLVLFIYSDGGYELYEEVFTSDKIADMIKESSE